MHTPRIIGKKKIKVEIFFEVQSESTILELVKAEIGYIQKYNIGINTKITKQEYTKPIGIFLRVNL